MCIRAPPISSSETFSPITISAIRGEPRYIEALPSRMITTSQNAGMYAPPAALGPNSTHTCGTTPGQPHLVEEDPPGVAAAREHLDLLVDPGAGGVDQVDERHAQRQRALLDPQDLLDRLRPPRPGLDGRVVGHHRDRAPADRPDPGDDALGAEAVLLPAGEQPLLGERARVEQPLDPLAHRELALLGGLLAVALAGRPASARVDRAV